MILQPHCEPHTLPQGSCTSQPRLSSHQVSWDGFALSEFINLSEQQTPLQLYLYHGLTASQTTQPRLWH